MRYVTFVLLLLALRSLQAPILSRSTKHIYLGKAEPFRQSILKWSKVRGLDPVLVAAVMHVENPWMRPSLRGRAGEYGLMQVKGYNAPCGPCLAQPDYNIQYGTFYLKKMMLLKGNTGRALSAYNTGPNNPWINQKYINAVGYHFNMMKTN